MAQDTKIEWCDDTLNLWWGCTKVSDGCKFCYAEALADHRYQKGNWGPKGTRKEVKSWRATLNKISKLAIASGIRRRVFVQSMSDTFEGPETMGGIESENWKTVKHLQDQLHEAIWLHPELDFLVLTKRPENVLSSTLGVDMLNGNIPANLWIGTSCEDQKTADERIPHLLKCPAAVRFLSCEPLIGPVDITSGRAYCISAYRRHDGRFDWDPFSDLDDAVSWVIVGGESGPRSRPMALGWVKDLVRQCAAASVPIFVKQLGDNPTNREGEPCPHIKAKKGKDMNEWPEELRMRQFPEVANA